MSAISETDLETLLAKLRSPNSAPEEWAHLAPLTEIVEFLAARNAAPTALVRHAENEWDRYRSSKGSQAKPMSQVIFDGVTAGAVMFLVEGKMDVTKSRKAVAETVEVDVVDFKYVKDRHLQVVNLEPRTKRGEQINERNVADQTIIDLKELLARKHNEVGPSGRLLIVQDYFRHNLIE